MLPLPENFESYNQARKNGFPMARYAGALGAALAAAKQKTIDWSGV